MADNDTDARELEDLTALVRSEGYARFLAHVAEEWGPDAQMRQIDRVLSALEPGNLDGELSTVAQVRAAAKQVEKIARWPEARLQELKAEKPKMARGLDALRRIARP